MFSSVELLILTTLFFGTAFFSAGTLQAADATFVGVLALAVEDEGVRKLGISDETRQDLLHLIDRREQAALSIAMDIKDLPESDIAARLAPFVAESERQGMALLTVEQRTVLQQIRVARQGMDSLRDPEMARVLELNDEQQTQVRQLVQKRAQDMTRGGENQRRITRALYERKLVEILSPEQRVNWERLAGFTSADGQVSRPTSGNSAARATISEPAPEVAETAAARQTTAGAQTAAPNDRAAVYDGEEATLEFNFRHQPWQQVLEWFAQEADLSLITDFYPEGTFNYRDTRRYTPAEAIDLMNGVLLIKGYTLVRRHRLLTLVNLDDEIPPQLVELVPLTELDYRGEFELIKCLFQLAKLDAADAEEEISKLVGPQGAIVALPKASQILITETAGRLRTIRSVIESVENPRAGMQQGILEVELNHVTPEDVLTVARPLLSLEDESNVSEDIRIAVDPFTSRIFATGTRESIQKLQDIVPLVDRAPNSAQRPIAVLEQPQMGAYDIGKADGAQVLSVVQTLLAGLPDVRLSVDPVTNKLIALARPAEHRTIMETLRMLEGDAERTEVIQLRRDPQLIILAINKLFGLDDEETAAQGPKVDGDPTTMKLFVHGTRSQIAQVRELVEQIEGPESENALGMRQKVRILPFSGSGAKSALETAELLFRTRRDNPIRVVSPSTQVGGVREQTPAVTPRSSPPAADEAAPAPDSPAPDETLDRRTETSRPVTTWLVSYPQAPPAESPESESPESKERPRAADQPKPSQSGSTDSGTASTTGSVQSESRRPAEIVVQITPNGVIIASDDLDALDEFETLVRSFMEGDSVLGGEPTVFWLKYAKADVVAETLQQILGGGSTTTGGTSLLGEVASSVLGDAGGFLSGVLGGGSSSVPTGSASIVADVRLNCLIVQASATDLNLIERVLPVIDRESGPESVQTSGKPRLIPVVYLAADDMATILRQVYTDRVAGNQPQGRGGGGGGGGGGQQFSPADFFRRLRGGGGGRGGGGQAQRQVPQMTIGVDSRSNSLIVTAAEPLFNEVEALVRELDQEGMEADDSMSVVTVKTNPELIQQALASMVGEQVQTSSSSSTGSSGSNSRSGQTRTGGTTGDSAAAAQRRLDFFRRRFGGGGGTRGGTFGRGTGGASTFGRGGSPFGGRGGGTTGGRGGGGTTRGGRGGR